jgi:signal transduction histidine kinase
MKKYFLIILISNFLPNLIAQNYYRDSLWQIVKLGKIDTNSIDAYCKYGGEIGESNHDSGSFYLQKSLELSQKINYLKGIGNAYNSLSYHEGYLKENRDIGLNYAHINLNWAKKIKSKFEEGKAYFSFAVIYQRNLNYDSSKYYYEKAIVLLEKENPKYTGIIYGNLAGMYDDLNMPDKTFEYGDKALAYYFSKKDTTGIISIYISKGSACYWLKDTLGEQQYYEKALNLALKIDNKPRMKVCYNNLVAVLRMKGKLDSCLYFLNKALEIEEKIGTKRSKMNLLILKAEIERDKKNYKAALNILEPLVKDTAKSDFNVYSHLNFLIAQYGALKGLERYKEANEVLDKYSDYKEIEYFQLNSKQMLELDDKLKKSEQAKQLFEQENKLTKQGNIITYLIFGLIISALLGLGFFYFQHLKTEAKNKELLSFQRDQELKETKAILEGQFKERIRISKEIHDDLGSSMTSISLLSEVLKKKIDTAIYPEINRISHASSEMVDKMNEIIWTLNIGNDNVQSLVAYIRKFATNFLDDAQLMLSFEAENLPLEKQIDGSVRRNIYLCVKEAINNTVKHADAHKIEVKIDTNMAVRHPDSIWTAGLIITIKDDGKGIDTQHISILGNGLKNMQKRMHDIGGQFLIHNNNGTEITLSYPF